MQYICLVKAFHKVPHNVLGNKKSFFLKAGHLGGVVNGSSCSDRAIITEKSVKREDRF